MKTEFVTVVSQSCTPFAALDSSVQVIQKYGLEHLLPEQREQMEQLAEGLKRARTMINNLVTFAAFLSKQGQLWMSPVDVGELARETMQMLDPMAQARGIRLSFRTLGPVPPVYGDRDRLAEAIHHLAHNAIRFNRQGGSVKLTCRAEPDQVILEVGHGLGHRAGQAAGNLARLYPVGRPSAARRGRAGVRSAVGAPCGQGARRARLGAQRTWAG
jgi:two-component system phosphate regulon sensor histidine kinase PhoR